MVRVTAPDGAQYRVGRRLFLWRPRRRKAPDWIVSLPLDGADSLVGVLVGLAFLVVGPLIVAFTILFGEVLLLLLVPLVFVPLVFVPLARVPLARELARGRPLLRRHRLTSG